MEYVYKKDGFITKLFACLFIAMFIIMCLVGNFVFADSELVVTLPNFDNLLSDRDKWFIYYSPVSSKYCLFITDADDIRFGGNNHISELVNSDPYIPASYDINDYYYLYLINCSYKKIYILSDDNWSAFSSSSHDVPLVNSYFTFYYLDNICASNFDLKNYEYFFNNNDVVFRKAPTLSTLKGTNFQVVWEEIMKEIIQILPIVMIVVVSFLALRKALATLFNFLRTS